MSLGDLYEFLCFLIVCIVFSFLIFNFFKSMKKPTTISKDEEIILLFLYRLNERKMGYKK